MSLSYLILKYLQLENHYTKKLLRTFAIIFLLIFIISSPEILYLSIKFFLQFLYKNINNLHPEFGISPFLCLANQNLFPNGGVFRESNALVTNSNVKCTDPKKISKELKDLDAIFNDIISFGKYINEHNDYTKVDDYIRQVLILKAKVINIHPFIDGNGRMGRLWQSLILGKLHPIFENLPVENMVFSNQEEYYKAISESNIKGNSSPFIEFMLNMILSTLKHHQESQNVGINVGINNQEKEIINLILENNRITIAEVASALSLSQRQAERLFSSLKNKGFITRQGSSKKGYWIVIKKDQIPLNLSLVSIKANPNRFKPFQFLGSSIPLLPAFNPIPHIASYGLASTKTLSPVSIKNFPNCSF